MWRVFLPINLYQPLGQSTPKLPYGEPLVWEIPRVVNYIFLLFLSPSSSLSPPRCPARPSSPSCNKSSPPLRAVAIDRRRPCLRHHGEIHQLPSTSSLAVHADHASFRYVAMPGLPIYHLLLPVPSRSMQAVMHDWKATYAIGVRIHWPSTAVHRNPTLPAAIIVSSVNARKY